MNDPHLPTETPLPEEAQALMDDLRRVRDRPPPTDPRSAGCLVAIVASLALISLPFVGPAVSLSGVALIALGIGLAVLALVGLMVGSLGGGFLVSAVMRDVERAVEELLAEYPDGDEGVMRQAAIRILDGFSISTGPASVHTYEPLEMARRLGDALPFVESVERALRRPGQGYRVFTTALEQSIWQPESPPAMTRRTSDHGYPIFSMPPGVENWDALPWKAMIDEMSPSSLVRAGRVPASLAPHAIHLLDCCKVFDEGDVWLLCLVDVESSGGGRSTLFLPLMATVLSERPENDRRIDRHLRSDPGLVAFGIDTRSPLYGHRAWLQYDGFLEGQVLELLLGLFWPDDNYYAIDVRDGEHGRLRFHTDLPPTNPRVVDKRVHADADGNLTINYGQSLTLSIPSDLRTLEPESVEADPETAGWIAYERDDHPPIVIGVLRRASG